MGMTSSAMAQIQAIRNSLVLRVNMPTMPMGSMAMAATIQARVSTPWVMLCNVFMAVIVLV